MLRRDRLRRRDDRPRRDQEPVDLPPDRRLGCRAARCRSRTLADRRDLVLSHFRMVAEREPSKYALHKLRKFTGWYTHGLPNGKRLRQAINQTPRRRELPRRGRALLRRAPGRRSRRLGRPAPAWRLFLAQPMPEIVLIGTPENARRALNTTVAAWGAAWTENAGGGDLGAPRGRRAAPRPGPWPGRDRARSATARWSGLREAERRLEINQSAVAVLAIGALAGVLLLLWPFFPRLLAAAPLAAVLAFLAWFMVVSRLRTSGPEEFLDQVRQAAGESSLAPVLLPCTRRAAARFSSVLSQSGGVPVSTGNIADRGSRAEFLVSSKREI